MVDLYLKHGLAVLVANWEVSARRRRDPRGFSTTALFDSSLRTNKYGNYGSWETN